MPIAVLSEYTEKEYEPFDPYSRFYPAMPISVCFSDTALCTLGKFLGGFFVWIVLIRAPTPSYDTPSLRNRDTSSFGFVPGEGQVPPLSRWGRTERGSGDTGSILCRAPALLLRRPWRAEKPCTHG